MNVYEAISKRRSIRRYKSEPVAKEQLDRVLEAARWAPSWKNLQCWKFIVVTGDAEKASIAAALADTNPGKKAMLTAPIDIVLCADPQKSGIMGDQNYYLVDCGITMEHLVLAACAEGLGTCWIGAFDEATVKKAMDVPAEWRVVAMTPLGHPDQTPPPGRRKEPTEIITYAKF